MAKENVIKFEALLRSDEDLQTKLKAATDTANDIQDEEAKFKTIIAPLAEESGLPFTFDELRAAFDEGLEMSEDELVNLSGGGFCCFIGGSDGEDVSDDCEGSSGLAGVGACDYVGICGTTF